MNYLELTLGLISIVSILANFVLYQRAKDEKSRRSLAEFLAVKMEQDRNHLRGLLSDRVQVSTIQQEGSIVSVTPRNESRDSLRRAYQRRQDGEYSV